MRTNTLRLLALLLLSTVACAADPLPVVSVRWQTVELGFPAEGIVEAVQQTTVGARVAGRVLEVRADAGQAVARGELLLRLDAREAGEAVRVAEAQYGVARLNYQRQQQLKEQKFISQAALDRARGDFDTAAAQRSSAVASASHATIVAPLAGVVARRHVEAGDMALPGSPLYTIYQPGSLRVTASVSQHRLPALRGAAVARVEFPELAKSVYATAIQVLPTVDAATHVAQVRLSLPALPDVQPGMFARVHFVTGRADKLTVPAAAIVRRGEVAAVYVQGPGNRPGLRQVRLGEVASNGEIEVLAGLANGDTVIGDPVRAAIALQSGH